ncbi:nitrogen regulation protein NR(I) [Paraneptunicella aestuarii]|uniref:nitrogen regulation protein NR(I) n=1 Tax=Paraneptunicella aestuarii TaxID=2831148 RepID=UPI001E565A81|nr:nitrogen regulation protein NR(I) [Paraneptunicella aestuarii]UAA38443.1 nitrogen regulation protein NR(I) [Paraneptunicella aestuarii]
MNSAPVWIVDDDSSIRWVLQKALQAANIECFSYENPEDVLHQIEMGSYPEVIVSDVRMKQMDGMQLVSEVHRIQPDIPFIIMTAHSDLDSAVSAYKSGAFEYLPKPFDMDEAVHIVQKALSHARSQNKARKQEENTFRTEIIGEAPAMQEVFRAIGRLSRSSISVLINGESGTGKELVAQALHKHSPRSDKAFIPLNMAAIPAELIESELFGHEKGAFTGAQTTRQGRFEQANGGTLFLDEIGDMPVKVQTRLLRVLADGQFYRVGGHDLVSVDVRIIAATHQDLEKLVGEGKFREDLFHRLNVIRIHLPTLSERREDIVPLASHFLNAAAEELKIETKTLSKETEKLIAQLAWPGNVRQLQNVCRWLTVMASGKEISPDDLPPEIQTQPATLKTVVSGGSWQDNLTSWVFEQLQAGKNNILNDAQEEFEKIMLQQALKYTHGHKQDAAKRLGWGRNTITRKLKELGMLEGQ